MHRLARTLGLAVGVGRGETRGIVQDSFELSEVAEVRSGQTGRGARPRALAKRWRKCGPRGFRHGTMFASQRWLVKQANAGAIGRRWGRHAARSVAGMRVGRSHTQVSSLGRTPVRSVTDPRPALVQPRGAYDEQRGRVFRTSTRRLLAPMLSRRGARPLRLRWQALGASQRSTRPPEFCPGVDSHSGGSAQGAKERKRDDRDGPAQERIRQLRAYMLDMVRRGRERCNDRGVADRGAVVAEDTACE